MTLCKYGEVREAVKETALRRFSDTPLRWVSRKVSSLVISLIMLVISLMILVISLIIRIIIIITLITSI